MLSPLAYIDPEATKSSRVRVCPGVAVDKKEIRAAFDFFDTKGRGFLTIADLKARLPTFYKSLAPRYCVSAC